MMTDGGKDPQSNQNSDAPFQTGAQDNEAPPGTPAGASPPAFSGSSWSPFYSPVHGGYAGLPAAPDAAQAGSADAGEPQEVDDNELQMAAQDGGPAVEGGGLTTDGQAQDTTISEAASLDAVASAQASAALASEQAPAALDLSSGSPLGPEPEPEALRSEIKEMLTKSGVARPGFKYVAENWNTSRGGGLPRPATPRPVGRLSVAADGSGQIPLSASKTKQLLFGKRSDAKAWTGLLGDNAVLSAKTTATPRTLIAGFISKAVDGPNAYDLHVRRHNSTVHEDDQLTAGETNMPPGMASSTTDITDFVVPDDVQDSVQDGKIIVEETMAVTNKGQDFVDFQTSHVISIPSPDGVWIRKRICQPIRRLTLSATGIKQDEAGSLSYNHAVLDATSEISLSVQEDADDEDRDYVPDGGRE